MPPITAVPWGLLTPGDFETIGRFLGESKFLPRKPDVTIAPDGNPYLFRWHLIPRNTQGNVYLHLQIASDPERPLHDHPWDNTSVILAGGYEELLWETPTYAHDMAVKGQRFAFTPRRLVRVKGQVIHRRAEHAHRLLLPADVPYSISLFTTGPVVRSWGFWTADGWKDHESVTETRPDGTSIYTGPHE